MHSGETELPYVGRKVSLVLEKGCRVEVVMHTDGTRDVAFFGPDDEGPSHLVRLDPGSACALGALLCASLEEAASS